MVSTPQRSWRQRALKALAGLVVLVTLPAAAMAQEPRDEAYIELSASEDEVYVQQELRLTVKLYYTNQVIQGQLNDPEHPDAIIERLGEQKQYRERVDGEVYRVVERDYVIFPQKPGQLQLPPLDFQGTARHPRGHHYRISDSAVLFPVNVREIPPQFSGRTWLPATDLSISASGLEQTGPVQPGDNLIRTLRVTVRGLPATTLPTLDIQYPDGIRSYPEPEQRESSATTDGVIGELQQTVALVPVASSGGSVTLPEVSIPWWDVNEDREKVAVLPARTLRLAAPAADEPAEPATETEAPSPPAPASAPVTAHWVWPLLVALLALGWATTAAAWWLQGRHRGQDISTSHPLASQEKDHFRTLCAKAQAQDPGFFNELPLWTGLLSGRHCHTTDGALQILHDPYLAGLVRQWRESLFHPDGGDTPDGKAVVNALKNARQNWQKEGKKGNSGKRQSLPDLYPEGLRP